jgi:hypothetical protein
MRCDTTDRLLGEDGMIVEARWKAEPLETPLLPRAPIPCRVADKGCARDPGGADEVDVKLRLVFFALLRLVFFALLRLVFFALLRLVFFALLRLVFFALLWSGLDWR